LLDRIPAYNVTSEFQPQTPVSVARRIQDTWASERFK